MKILFIAEAYAPDSIIGAQRIIKFTKYLSERGHDITVLTTSRIYGKEDLRSMDGLEKIRIIRTDGEKLISNPLNRDKSNGKIKRFLPEPIYAVLRKVYSQIVVPIYSLRNIEHIYHKMLACYQSQLINENFDIVFSTYSTMPDVLLGEYIHTHYGTPMVLDLRDKMDNALVPYFLRLYNHKIQGRIIGVANKTFIVSEVGMDELKHDYPDKAHKITTLYNGYDDRMTQPILGNEKKGVLSFAYTGGLYSGKRDLRPLFKTMKALSDKHNYKFKLDYAGEDYEILKQQADQYKMSNIINNYGSVNRDEAERIQNSADVFLVVTWNSKKAQGVLTGKFFEGIRAEKPIVAIVTGNLINSELYRMNEKYGYGICCETARDGSMQELYNYIKNLYIEKGRGRLQEYSSAGEIKEKFHYKNLTRELEGHLMEMLAQEDKH